MDSLMAEVTVAIAAATAATPAPSVSSIPSGIVHGDDICNEGFMPDPLLRPGTYIDVETVPPNKGDGKMPDLASVTEENMSEVQTAMGQAENVTSVRRASKSMEVNVERPDWLPENWGFETRVRSNGASAGLVDRYYLEPVTGSKFRSKSEVLYFLETGSKRKKGNTGTDATPSETPNSKKPKSTYFYFDSANPPERVCWIQTDTSADTWEPYIDSFKVPAAQRQEWDAVYSTVAELGEMNNSPAGSNVHSPVNEPSSGSI